MSLPLRIDDGLVKEARQAGGLFHRSISQQVEYWATLGQRLEAVVSTPAIARIKGLKAAEVDQALAKAASPGGRERMLAFLGQKQGTSYGMKPGQPGVLVEYPKPTRAVARATIAAKSAGSKKPKAMAKG